MKKKLKNQECMHEGEKMVVASIDWSASNPEIVKMIDAKMGKEGLINGDLIELARLGQVLLDIYDEGAKWLNIIED